MTWICAQSYGLSVGTVGSQQATAPASNALNDHPAMVWRTASGTVSTNIIIAGAPSPVDTVAVLFSNLRATDTVRVRGYNSQANATAGGSTGLVAGTDTTVQAFSGAKDASFRTKTVVKYTNPISGVTHWRIDITATGHPSGFIEVARLFVGSSVNLEDLAPESVRLSENRSPVIQGPWGDSVDEYPSLLGWRAVFDWIDQSVWNGSVLPLLQQVGRSRCVLFAHSDDQTLWQHNLCYGRITEQWEGGIKAADRWKVELTIMGLAA